MYTLVDRLSSRGYQGWHYYLSHAFVWTNPFALASVIVALIYRGRQFGALWVGIPLLLLSVLPHKEARYLLPILPFWCALASVGAWEAITRLRTSPQRERLAVVFLVLLFAGTLVEADRFRFRRSSDGVAAMQFVAAQQPRRDRIRRILGGRRETLPWLCPPDGAAPSEPGGGRAINDDLVSRPGRGLGGYQDQAWLRGYGRPSEGLWIPYGLSNRTAVELCDSHKNTHS